MTGLIVNILIIIVGIFLILFGYAMLMALTCNEPYIRNSKGKIKFLLYFNWFGWVVAILIWVSAILLIINSLWEVI